MNALVALTNLLHEPLLAGGSYVGPAHRLFFQSLALMVNARSILETGYDTGLTTMAFAMTGAEVIGVDNEFEQESCKEVARQRLHQYPNVSLVKSDALAYLLACPDERFDVIFIDDCHWAEYVAWEVQEVQRLIRPGGIVLFHDTLSYPLEAVVRAGFPPTWDRMQFPCVQSWERYAGNPACLGYDFGIIAVRRPYDEPLVPTVLADESTHIHDTLMELVQATGLTVTVNSTVEFVVAYRNREGTDLVLTAEEVCPLMPDIVALLRYIRVHPPLHAAQVQVIEIVRAILAGYGGHASKLAGRSEHARMEAGIFGKKVSNVAFVNA